MGEAIGPDRYILLIPVPALICIAAGFIQRLCIGMVSMGSLQHKDLCLHELVIGESGELFAYSLLLNQYYLEEQFSHPV